MFYSDKHEENSDIALQKNIKFFLSADYTVFMMGLSIIFAKKVTKLDFLLKKNSKEALSLQITPLCLNAGKKKVKCSALTYKCLSNTFANSALGCNPITESTFSPSLKTNKVGMFRIPKRLAA